MDDRGEAASTDDCQPVASLSTSSRAQPTLGRNTGVVVSRQEGPPKPVDASPSPPADPKKDLWLSSADGRYGSPPIPIRVGGFPNVETFYVRVFCNVPFDEAVFSHDEGAP